MMNFVILRIFFLLKSLFTILTIGIKMTEYGQYSKEKFPVTEPVADIWYAYYAWGWYEMPIREIS